jgi:hypothetical protein
MKVTTRTRRTRAEIQSIKDELSAILEAQHPATVRQVFYLAETRGLVPKTEHGYDAVGRYLLQMRVDGRVPFAWVADHTRWARKPPSHASLGAALQSTVRNYRRSLWDGQPAYVEVWCEKDALAGVLYEETRAWDVPLMVTRGFSSVTFLHEAAAEIRGKDRPAYLYYFGDHDPSGVAVDQSIERRLRQFAPEAEIHFRRVAVLPEQVTAWGLPARPTKCSDSRSKTFRGDSVEVDAISPVRLRQLVRENIERHIDRHAWEATRAAERAERETLRRLVGRLV